MYGDGTQSRCFTHVGDVVGALIELVDEPTRRSARSSTSATREEITILELAERVRDADRHRSRRSCSIPYDEAYEAGFEDMPRRVPDLAKIRALIGYEPHGAARRDPGARDRLFPEALAGLDWSSDLEATQARASESALLRRSAKPVRRLLLATGRDARPAARDRPDRKHQHLQREVRVLPARRHGSASRAIMDMALFQKIVDECAALGIDARAHAQLRRAVRRSLARREGALREAEGHPAGRHDQQRLAHHRGGRARDDRGRARRHQHQRGRVRQGSLRDDAGRPRSTTRSSPTSSGWSRLRERGGQAAARS